jgi:hypothetical protein
MVFLEGGNNRLYRRCRFPVRSAAFCSGLPVAWRRGGMGCTIRFTAIPRTAARSGTQHFRTAAARCPLSQREIR